MPHHARGGEGEGSAGRPIVTQTTGRHKERSDKSETPPEPEGFSGVSPYFYTCPARSVKPGCWFLSLRSAHGILINMGLVEAVSVPPSPATTALIGCRSLPPLSRNAWYWSFGKIPCAAVSAPLTSTYRSVRVLGRRATADEKSASVVMDEPLP